MEKICPCGFTQLYSHCCKPLHDGAFPDNALSLMRSRYSAYALSKADYIMHTTHPRNPNYNQNTKEWMKEIVFFSKNTLFQKLEILDFVDGETEAYVTFKAHLIQNEIKNELLEKSHFIKLGRQWLYFNAIYLQ